MYRRSSCAVLLLLVATCAAFSDGGNSAEERSNVEISLESENINVFRQANNCASDGDCHNQGKCETIDSRKFCNCKNGTSGDFCETVDNCAEELEMCGTLDDVSCVFDSELEEAVCKCDNDTKTYVDDEDRCMSPCTGNQCGRYGHCEIEIGNQTFCSCPLGMIGDYCEFIEWCHTKKVNCGVDNNATCTLVARKGTAYCKCDDPELGFDYDEKVCKDCSGCGEYILDAGTCKYKEGRRICSCDSGYYSSEEGVCEDCKCGNNGFRCSLENGTKLCECYRGSSQKGEICEKCECGTGQSKCEFVENKKLCTCKEGYAAVEEEGKCKEICSDTKPCQNGGECVQNFCNCLNGTRGDLCETVEYCTYHKCRFDSDCVYNITSQKGSCKCRDSKEVFDGSSNFCKRCDCGTDSLSCSYEYGDKKCTCKIDYAERYGTCQRCDCGTDSLSCSYEYGDKECTCKIDYAERYGTCQPCYCKNQISSPACYFKSYDKVCQCDEGYAQRDDDCLKCDCGENGNCTYDIVGRKICKCNEGYEDYNGLCKKCDCGKKGYCGFNFEGNKKCSCSYGYEEFEGTCLECNCGDYSNCKLLSRTTRECTCRSGYGMMQNSKCERCDCYPGNNCIFSIFDTKKCICPKGYADDRGTCKECDCKVDGANCFYVYSGLNKCQCPKGYEEVQNSLISLNSYCKDVDECKQQDVCPSSTECVNTVGSYDCVCKDGYEQYGDRKKDGCRDINECVRKWKPCTDSYAKCVNTPGSYKCICQTGYTLLRSYKEESNMCFEEYRPWRTASIVVGILSGVTIIVLILTILVRRNRQ